MISTTNFRLHRLARVLGFGMAAVGFAGQASAEELLEAQQIVRVVAAAAPLASSINHCPRGSAGGCVMPARLGGTTSGPNSARLHTLCFS